MKKYFLLLPAALLLLFSCNNPQPAAEQATTSDAPKEDPAAKAIAAYDKTNAALLAGNWDEFKASLAEDAVDHPLGWPDIKGRDSIAAMVKVFLTSCSNFKFEALQKSSDGEYVFCHYHCSGDIPANGMGMKMKGGHFDYTGIEMVKFNKDGLSTDHWDYPDWNTFAAQVGVDISSMAPPTEKKK